jgi:hypothetical protein
MENAFHHLSNQMFQRDIEIVVYLSALRTIITQHGQMRAAI